MFVRLVSRPIWKHTLLRLSFFSIGQLEAGLEWSSEAPLLSNSLGVCLGQALAHPKLSSQAHGHVTTGFSRPTTSLWLVVGSAKANGKQPRQKFGANIRRWPVPVHSIEVSGRFLHPGSSPAVFYLKALRQVQTSKNVVTTSLWYSTFISCVFFFWYDW